MCRWFLSPILEPSMTRVALISYVWHTARCSTFQRAEAVLHKTNSGNPWTQRLITLPEIIMEVKFTRLFHFFQQFWMVFRKLRDWMWHPYRFLSSNGHRYRWCRYICFYPRKRCLVGSETQDSIVLFFGVSYINLHRISSLICFAFLGPQHYCSGFVI